MNVLDALVAAYEDAGLRGLCGEGRWEAAVAAVRSMSPRWKPEHYSTVSPYLIVDGAARTMDFLERVFGATRLRHFPAPDGKVMHAEVRIGDSVIMVADGNEGWPPIGAHVHVYVEDVEDTYRRALEAGAESVQAPVRKDDEDRRGGVKDPGGTTWWIASREV